MTTIKEIKTIKIELADDGTFRVIYNGIEDDLELNIPFENYRQAARTLTRIAIEMWARMDATMNKNDGNNERTSTSNTRRN